MHDLDTMRGLAWLWLGFIGIMTVAYVAAYTFGTGERREASRRGIRQNLGGGSGWLLLSLTLKNAGYVLPHRHLDWLWIPTLALAALTWLIKGLRWFMHWRKRTRRVETTYTRTLRGGSRRRP